MNCLAPIQSTPARSTNKLAITNSHDRKALDICSPRFLRVKEPRDERVTLLPQLIKRSFAAYLPVMQKHQPIRERFGTAHVMGHDHRAHLAAPLQFHDEFHDLRGGDRVPSR